jgi:hypothetical protein
LIFPLSTFQAAGIKVVSHWNPAHIVIKKKKHYECISMSKQEKAKVNFGSHAYGA